MMHRPHLTGKNRITEAFYNGPRFRKFVFWENTFLLFVGGVRGARRRILRHLGDVENKDLLEVGIGDGANVHLLPRSTRITGVDIAGSRLIECRRRCEKAGRDISLVLAEGEHLPLADDSFDLSLSVGGLNHYSDPAAAIREMSRVTRPGGRIVVADEIPNIVDYAWGHRIWCPKLDDWIIRHWFGDEFHRMVMQCNTDPKSLANDCLSEGQVHRIWRGYGYCIVGRPTENAS